MKHEIDTIDRRLLAELQRDATLTVVEPVRGGMPEREYNSSDEDSVTTDSNEGQEEEDSSDYSSSDDETTLPQVTTLESVLAMIPFTPDWWEARARRLVCPKEGGFTSLLGVVSRNDEDGWSRFRF